MNRSLIRNFSAFAIALVAVALPSVAFAGETGLMDMVAPGLMVMGIALGAGLAIGLAALGGALGQGRSSTAALEGIARNPAASGKIFTPMIIGLALIESLVIYALVIAFMLQSNIGTIVGLLGGGGH